MAINNLVAGLEELMNGLTLLLLTSARWEPRDQAGPKKPIIPGQPHLLFFFFWMSSFLKDDERVLTETLCTASAVLGIFQQNSIGEKS